MIANTAVYLAKSPNSPQLGLRLGGESLALRLLILTLVTLVGQGPHLKSVSTFGRSLRQERWVGLAEESTNPKSTRSRSYCHERASAPTPATIRWLARDFTSTLQDVNQYADQHHTQGEQAGDHQQTLVTPFALQLANFAVAR